MTTTILTAGNYDTYFALDFAYALASGVEHKIKPDSPLVTKIVAQAEAKGYTMDRSEAARILNNCRQ